MQWLGSWHQNAEMLDKDIKVVRFLKIKKMLIFKK